MSRIVPLDSAVFFELQLHEGGAESKLVELCCLCLNGLVITLHGTPISHLEWIGESSQPTRSYRKPRRLRW